MVAVALLGRRATAGVIHGRPSFFQRPKPPRIDTTSRVAELLQRLGRERGAGAARAVHDDRRVAVGELVLDLALEVAARDEHRAGDHPLLVLVELADVEERGVAQARFGVGRLDLADVLLGLCQ